MNWKIRAAWQYAVETENQEAIGKAVQALALFYGGRSRELEAVKLFEEATDKWSIFESTDPDVMLLAIRFQELAWFYIRLGRFDDAQRVQERVQFCYEQLGISPIYGAATDPVLLRRRVGMVFQRPNAFAKSIFDNVAYGLQIIGWRNRAQIAERVEQVLRQAALWDEVKDRLTHSAYGLSGGQQQRLCIARAIALRPDVLLMDEPCSALDPIATLKIEELMLELRREYTIVIVTHNMQQAARASDETAFMLMHPQSRAGQLVEFGATSQIFTHPQDKRTEDYVTGRFG